MDFHNRRMARNFLPHRWLWDQTIWPTFAAGHVPQLRASREARLGRESRILSLGQPDWNLDKAVIDALFELILGSVWRSDLPGRVWFQTLDCRQPPEPTG